MNRNSIVKVVNDPKTACILPLIPGCRFEDLPMVVDQWIDVRTMCVELFVEKDDHHDWDVLLSLPTYVERSGAETYFGRDYERFIFGIEEEMQGWAFQIHMALMIDDSKATLERELMKKAEFRSRFRKMFGANVFEEFYGEFLKADDDVTATS